MDIPGLPTMYAIFTRRIGVKNDALKQRKELAQELLENCQLWSQVLLTTFSTAVERWKIEGREAAEREIVAQQEDFMKLNYWSLKHDSPILKFLGKDERFEPFVDACATFYESALSVKRFVWGQIEDYPGHFVSAHQAELEVMLAAWRTEIERMLHNVVMHHMEIKILTSQ